MPLQLRHAEIGARHNAHPQNNTPDLSSGPQALQEDPLGQTDSAPYPKKVKCYYCSLFVQAQHQDTAISADDQPTRYSRMLCHKQKVSIPPLNTTVYVAWGARACYFRPSVAVHNLIHVLLRAFRRQANVFVCFGFQTQIQKQLSYTGVAQPACRMNVSAACCTCTAAAVLQVLQLSSQAAMMLNLLVCTA